MTAQKLHQCRFPQARFTGNPVYSVRPANPVRKIDSRRALENPLKGVLMGFFDFRQPLLDLLELQTLDDSLGSVRSARLLYKVVQPSRERLECLSISSIPGMGFQQRFQTTSHVL